MKTTDYVTVVLLKPLDKDFKSRWSDKLIPHIHKVGWVTRVTKRQWLSASSFVIHPEDNKYGINFFKKDFELYCENNIFII